MAHRNLRALPSPLALGRDLSLLLLLGSLFVTACDDSDSPTGSEVEPAGADDDRGDDDQAADDDDDDDQAADDDDDEGDAGSSPRLDASAARDAGRVSADAARPNATADAASKTDGGSPSPNRDGSTPRSDAAADIVPDSGSDATREPTGGSRPPCLQKPSQVVALGDSYVGAPVMLIPKIEDLARTDGALAAGQRYRDYGQPGTTMGSPSSPGSIPPQWTAATREDMDIKTVIMDGGGNDIIGSLVCLADGSHMDAFCIEIVQGVIDMTRQMAEEMQEVGVTDVLYFLYPHVPLGGNDILDYSVDKGKAMCAELTTENFRCHLIDTRPAFEGHPEYFGLDPIHANEAGSRKIAELVYETMESNCIAQPESSGCCEP